MKRSIFGVYQFDELVGAVVLASHDEDPYRGTWGFAIAAVRVGP